MKCHVHPDTDAIGMCVGCGKPICEACLVEVKGRNYCKSCAGKLASGQLSVPGGKAAGQKRFEHRRIQCPDDTDVMNALLQMYQLFYWEPTQTQTVVSRESHLEEPNSLMEGLLDESMGEKTIYSVTTTERFMVINLRRNKDIANLEQIRAIEDEYFRASAELSTLGCSITDNYTTPPPHDIGIRDILPLFNPFFAFFHFFKWLGQCIRVELYPLKLLLGFRKRKLEKHSRLKAKLDQLLETNQMILNV